MSRQVRETKAAQSIRAIIVLNKKGEHVATVQAHFASSTVTVDVWHESGAVELQQGRAGGYGYDKFAAALSGLTIDGHTMADHCGRVPEAEKARAKLLADYRKEYAAGHLKRSTGEYWNAKAAKLGCRFANWDSESGWQSLHFVAGLGRLEMLGYRVITAI